MLSARRDFLRLAVKSAGTAGALAALAESIPRALAVLVNSPAGTIRDVEHVVIFRPENRSFGHYFGTMRGVRGFGDRITLPLASRRSVRRQRSKSAEEVLAFHLDTSTTRAHRIESLDHRWPSGHQTWNDGKYDDWIDAKTGLTMGYYEESDIPFQFALAPAFTFCDAYFCSMMGPTDPNRLYHWIGSINPPGNKVGALINNSLCERGIASWTTFPERLEKEVSLGASIRSVYQKGIEKRRQAPF